MQQLKQIQASSVPKRRMPKCVCGMCHGVILIGVVVIVFGLGGVLPAWPQRLIF